jgi:maltooligosyltrehalose trehalohydrolase
MVLDHGPAPPLGAAPLGAAGTRFLVWAPAASAVRLRIVGPPALDVAMHPCGHGYYEAVVEGAGPGTRYWYCLDDGPTRPDPASRCQPEGVHGPSEVVSETFPWTDAAWRGRPLVQYVIYELHVGAFTPEGTFDAALPRLDVLAAAGVTAVEIMPVAHFPGVRNWGYDGAYLFAVHEAYGGPAGFKRFVDACHARGLAVVLDVVYNHFGPEGSYVGEFGPYFTDRYRTPWGAAVNFDGPQSDGVRRFFIENALRWIDEFHVDALRLDAVHAIMDQSAQPFLAQLANAVHAQAARCGRMVYAIAESNLNDPRLVRPGARGGYGLDAQWSDDLHHALHAVLTPERTGYYADYGGVADLGRALADGFVYAGRYSPYRRRRYGAPCGDLGGHRFVVCTQNHDQVGNRARGDRLTRLVSFEALKAAAGVALLSPYVPLLFMGEEYGEPAPFQYFTSHSDPAIGEAVRRGRRAEFEAWGGADEVPDPQDPATFLRSKLTWELRQRGHHRALLDFYAELLRLRRAVPALTALDRETMRVHVREEQRLLVMHRWHGRSHAVAAFNFGDAALEASLPAPRGRWTVMLDSSDARWGGPGRVAPPAVESNGLAALRLRPAALVLLVCGQGAERPPA